MNLPRVHNLLELLVVGASLVFIHLRIVRFLLFTSLRLVAGSVTHFLPLFP